MPNVLEYFHHGARKGLADTALKTADSPYDLKLYDVAQASVVNEFDVARRGILKKAIYKGEEIDIPLSESITGRTALDTIMHPMTDEVVVKKNELITLEIAASIEAWVLIRFVRSVLTCDTVVCKASAAWTCRTTLGRRRPRRRHDCRPVHW